MSLLNSGALTARAKSAHVCSEKCSIVLSTRIRGFN